MPLSKIAQKLLAYLNIYHISPTVYNNRIDGSYDNQYNHGKFVHGLTTTARIKASTKKGLFATALAELVAEGY